MVCSYKARKPYTDYANIQKTLSLVFPLTFIWLRFKGVPVSVVQQLENFGKIADKNQKYLDEIGYYGQWLVLESTNPEPRIGLAHAYLGAHRYLESFQ